jgi:hypothetical protein
MEDALDREMFLAENVVIVEAMAEEVMRELEFMTQDQAHARMLDHCYHAGDNLGVTSLQFQNMAATALVLLAIERKKNAK